MPKKTTKPPDPAPTETILPSDVIMITPDDLARMAVRPTPARPPRETFRGRTGIVHELVPDHGPAHDLMCDGNCGTVVGVRQLPLDGRPITVPSGVLCAACAEAKRAREDT